ILTRTPPPISTLFPYTTLFRSYENIVVTDLNSGLSAESDVPFLLSFGGAHGIIAGNLEGQIDFQSESGLYDICMCDFDNDGRNRSEEHTSELQSRENLVCRLLL